MRISSRLVVSLAFVFPTLVVAAPLRVLTYDSMLGKGSLGEFLKNEFPKFCKGCEVEFTSTRELSGLLGRLRSDKRRGLKNGFDLVLGFDDLHLQAAKSEGLVSTSVAFDESPFALIVDSKRFPKSAWPKSWAELETKVGKEIIVEDPRSSSPGAGWLTAIYAMKAITPGTAKKITKRVFPSWSSAYEAFLNSEGKAVWSYRASEAYHRCNEKNDEDKSRYLALPLAEGYPSQVEWAAQVLGRSAPNAQRFLDFLVSHAVQSAIPQKNWMYPISKNTPLPDCFKNVTALKTWKADKPTSMKVFSKWIDEWSL